jgi:hypothetical protein
MKTSIIIRFGIVAVLIGAACAVLIAGIHRGGIAFVFLVPEFNLSFGSVVFYRPACVCCLLSKGPSRDSGTSHHPFDLGRLWLYWDVSPHALCDDCCLTPRWSQRRLPLEFMDGLDYTTVIELAEPFARRRGSALDR